ncbi:hypothetical protein SELMODRAFT_441764 [Selaginella moellendorffii]|uniref:Transaldolase n=1 Tax=Selaginella moellendorffii TaxID=88036 RepID=D8RMF2_SELML|nr:uncharacterized protein LOC9651046 [Selaginella moellendorffii]EFJ26330.1 hypothetical protein SELMODRAFT_441764 [Selaginella moellendorffii]|eukprot:XP_002972244.1 uncharacterized protein LOC9651046 [Selaginella moellendorffii]
MASLSSSSGSMRLFVDSSDIQAWKKWLPTGVFYGVTTNPLLLRESNVACQTKSIGVLSNQALRLGAKEIHLQAWGKSSDALLRTASELASIDSSVVVQIPATYEGLRAASKLKDMGARIALIIYSMHQALLALGIGAEYVTLDVGKSPSDEESKAKMCSSVQGLVRRASGTTKQLVANVLSLDELTTCLVASSPANQANSFALTPSAIEELFADKFTDDMVNEFEAAASKNNFSLFL